MHKKIHIDLDCNRFVQEEHPAASSCTKHQVHELNDIYDQFGGMPKTYVFENTMIHQRFYTEEELDFDELGEKLDMQVVTVSSILQPPGQTIPWHRDTFYQIKKRYPEDTRMLVRANIYLEDWKIGHFLQYDNVVDSNWKQGDGHMWNSEVLHIGANSGMENKYTLQVSGFYLGD